MDDLDQLFSKYPVFSNKEIKTLSFIPPYHFSSGEDCTSVDLKLYNNDNILTLADRFVSIIREIELDWERIKRIAENKKRKLSETRIEEIKPSLVNLESATDVPSKRGIKFNKIRNEFNMQDGIALIGNLYIINMAGLENYQDLIMKGCILLSHLNQHVVAIDLLDLVTMKRREDRSRVDLVIENWKKSLQNLSLRKFYFKLNKIGYKLITGNIKQVLNTWRREYASNFDNKKIKMINLLMFSGPASTYSLLPLSSSNESSFVLDTR